MPNNETPLLDELEKGKWPSFVREIKKAAEKSPMAKDLLHQLELSYKDRIGHWKHGGIGGVKGYGSGVIGRYSDRPDLFPQFPRPFTHPGNHPPGWFYKTDTLRRPVRHLGQPRQRPNEHARLHRDAILLGRRRAPAELLRRPVGGRIRPGRLRSALRTPSCCVGRALRMGLRRQPGSLPHLTMNFPGRDSPAMFPTSSRSRSPPVRTTAWRPSPGPIFPSSGPGRATSGSIRPRWRLRRGGLNIQRRSATCSTRCMEWDGRKLVKQR